MAGELIDPREFRATYFALRNGLVLCSAFVLAAPVSLLVLTHHLPPSISDSWYTPARAIFVLGLAAASVLLVVVSGDTLTEQTLLNVAGGLGLVVAGAADWPKDERGSHLPAFPPDVARENAYTLGALLVVGILSLVLVRLGVFGRRRPEDDWKVHGTPRLVLRLVYPTLFLLGAVGFFWDRTGLAEHVHVPAAVLMFLLLAGIAWLRTRWGLAALARIGDRPVDRSLGERREIPEGGELDSLARRYDGIYAALSAAMVATLLVAGVLALVAGTTRWVLWVELALLVLFAAFWQVQTHEASSERRERAAGTASDSSH